MAAMRQALIANCCRIRATRARCCGSASLTACLLVLGTVFLAREVDHEVVVLMEFQEQFLGIPKGNSEAIPWNSKSQKGNSGGIP